MSALPQIVLHHTALEHRGGAVGVARMLLDAQRAQGLAAFQSFETGEPEFSELAEAGAAAPSGGLAQQLDELTGLPLAAPCEAGEAGARLMELALSAGADPAQCVLHVHGSQDWLAMLSSVLWECSQSAERPRLLITLHDARPLTGGCAYPLDCPYFPFGCVDPCPRGFPDVAAGQGELMGLFAALAEATGLLLASPSRWLAEQAQAVLADMPLRVIPNGVPWPVAGQLLPRARAKALLGLPQGARVALFAAHGGARAAYKSGAQWPEYWGEIRAQLSRTSPELARGDALRALAIGGDEAGTTPDGLTLWPYVDRPKLALAMRAADVLAYPTLADNHPLVLLEAAAQELPVVSYAVGGVPEIVTHEATGLLVPEGDRPGLAQAAARLLDSPLLARRMGQAAYDQGQRRFPAARMAADYQKALSALLS